MNIRPYYYFDSYNNELHGPFQTVEELRKDAERTLDTDAIDDEVHIFIAIGTVDAERSVKATLHTTSFSLNGS